MNLKLLMHYGVLHAINGGVYATKDGVTWAAIAAVTGYHEDTLRQAVADCQKGTKDDLTSKMVKALVDAIPRIHKEVPLHTYTADLFEGVFELREREEQARDLFKKIKAASTVAEVQSLWTQAQESIMGVWISRTVDQALQLEREEKTVLDAKERTTIYLGAAVLHSLLIVWEDAAKVMQKVKADAVEDKTLDFVGLNLDAFSIVDLAEAALGLYQLVEAELLSLLRNQRALIAEIKASLVEIKIDEREGAKETEEPELKERLRSAQSEFDLIEQDRAIVNMNIASISSHAEDWNDPAHGYFMLMGLPTHEARKRLIGISGLCGMTMLQAVPLMKRHKRNLLVARNLAYMALQHDFADVLVAAGEHLAEELKIDPSMVWSFRIANREPLVSEKDIADKFQDGQPIIMKKQEAA